MTADRKRPTGPPPSAGVLARYAQAYARELGVAESRVRAWVAYMIMAGILERTTGADGPRFMVKGGVALELRLRDRARATKDIDVILRNKESDLADALEQALTVDPYQGFSFRRKGEPLLLDNGAVNVEFAVAYRGQPWTSITVDVAHAEAGESDVEWVEAIALTDAFGVTGPAQLPCLPIRFHVAQKLHGMTQPGLDEQFDADRFGLWLEVMMESGAAVAAQKLARRTSIWRSRGSRSTCSSSILQP